MKGKLKALGLTLAAAMALSAIAASGAQGANFFHAHLGEENAHNLIVTGESLGTQVFTPAAGEVESLKCKKVTYEGTEEAITQHKETDKSLPFTHINAGVMTITATNITVTPTYSECSFAGGVATVTTSGCHFRFTSETSASEHGGTHIDCEAGKNIVISAVGCEIKIGSQTSAGGVHYVSETSGQTTKRDIKGKTTASGVSYVTNGAFSCVIAGVPKEGSEGVFSGESTFKAFEDEKATATGSYKESTQLGLWWGPTQ